MSSNGVEMRGKSSAAESAGPLDGANGGLEAEYRQDPISGRWVIIAPERARRPLALSSSKPHSRFDAERADCPFCEGREDQSPPEILAYRFPGSPANGPGWRLRVVPNKFPAVRDDLPLDMGTSVKDGVGKWLVRPGFGQHEVIVECPEHETNPARLGPDRLADVFHAYRERVRSITQDPRIAYVSLFKNVGAEAGASLAHCHSQLLALPFVPPEIAAEWEQARQRYEDRGCCPFCELLEDELRAQVRVIEAAERFIAIAPFASRFAYEIWVLPRRHESRFEAATDDELHSLARLLQSILDKLDFVLADPAYNWLVRCGPPRGGSWPYYHWHLQLLPRTSRVAGFEWGTGCFINAVRPEDAAEQLRQASAPCRLDISP